MRKISFLIYTFLSLLDRFFTKIFKKSFLIFFSEFINEDFYLKKKNK